MLNKRLISVKKEICTSPCLPPEVCLNWQRNNSPFTLKISDRKYFVGCHEWYVYISYWGRYSKRAKSTFIVCHCDQFLRTDVLQKSKQQIRIFKISSASAVSPPCLFTELWKALWEWKARLPLKAWLHSPLR